MTQDDDNLPDPPIGFRLLVVAGITVIVAIVFWMLAERSDISP